MPLFHMISGGSRPVAPFSHAVEADGWALPTGHAPAPMPCSDSAPLGTTPADRHPTVGSPRAFWRNNARGHAGFQSGLLCRRNLHLGDVLMLLPHLVIQSAQAARPDVAESQAANLASTACQILENWANVPAGRTQAAFASQRGLDQRAFPLTALQEYRRRGCLRAKSFLQCASWLSPQHVRQRPKRSSTSTSLFRLSRPTPASTSKTSGRAVFNLPGRPARFRIAAPLCMPTELGGASC